MIVPAHYKELARYMRDFFGEPSSIAAYRDNNGKRRIDIGAFGASPKRFYSTIGVCDQKLGIPAGRFELAATGDHEWLPNALASSLYWLRDRTIESWPMVCEDTVRHNAKSTYRHMVFVPSVHSFPISSGDPVQWLLGIPIKDSEISIDLHTTRQKALKLFPEFMKEYRANKPLQGTPAKAPSSSAEPDGRRP